MKLSNSIRRAAFVVALSACAAGTAMAKDSGFYVGASFGQATYDTVDPAVGVFPFVVDRKREEDDWAYSLAFGYRIMPYVGIELALNDFGDLEEREQGFTTSSFAVGGIADLELGTRGPSLAVVGSLPLDKFELFAKVGAMRAETKGRVRIAQIFGNLPGSVLAGAGIETIKHTAMMYGAGAGYTIGDSLFLKLEYTAVPKVTTEDDDGIDTDVAIVSFGFQYRF